MALNDEPAPNETIAAVLTIELMLRAASGTARQVGADYNSYMIYMTIVAASLGRVFRADDYDPADVHLAGVARVPGISRAAISRTTGIPKETVRRKVEQLLADGLVQEGERDGSLKPNLQSNPALAESIALNTVSLRRFGAELRRYAHLTL